MPERPQPPVRTRKKLIEVALPLDPINRASAREKSIRHGHPSTLHLWWARRPLAAARAVIFAQLVDDPSACPEEFPTEEAQERERQRLFRLIEELVPWEATTNQAVLERARAELRRSWRRTCADNRAHPRAAELFDPERLPAFHDPFAGGGALPLEAQRLGLEAHASDLNPVAVLINKAMIELPPRFAGRPPVHPETRRESTLLAREWRGAQGLAEDLRCYGKWLRDEAERRIGHLYPEVEVTPELAEGRPDLEPLVSQRLKVIAWLWARTVPSPDPALGGAHVPLVGSFWICKKPGKLAWIEPVVDEERRTWRFLVRTGTPRSTAEVGAGTKVGRGTFRCMLSGTPMAPKYLHEQGKGAGIGYRMVAVVAAGARGRVYLPAPLGQEETARRAQPAWHPESALGTNTRHMTPVAYGYATHASLFTPRQLTLLDTLASLVAEARARALEDARAAGLEAGASLDEGGAGARAYADAVAILLGLCVSRRHDRWTAFSIWDTTREGLASLVRLSAVPMTWEFAEGNPFSESTGNFLDGVALTAKAVESLGIGAPGTAVQRDARAERDGPPVVVCTDPPYFDNIPYADLSDLFYVWLRRALRPVLPDLVSTMLVPKADELVADPARHGGRAGAERFFFDGMRQALARLRERANPAVPLAIFYAFKQSEAGSSGVVSTGWDAFLSALAEVGFSVVGTWPMRTEQTGGLRNVGRNSLATSVILVCRPRVASAPTATRRELVKALKAELPVALGHLQRSHIAPVDLAQAAIGPGMAVFTRYASVIDADGKPVSVRAALALINEVLDEVLAEQEGELDVDSRWALAWFEESGFSDGPFGVAETLSKAKNTSVAGIVEAGLARAGAGKVRLLRPDELPADWDPATDRRPTVWESVHHLIRALDQGGEPAAAALLARLGSAAEAARDLAYRLYVLCERRKWAKEAGAYNGLVVAWPELERLAAGDAPAGGLGPQSGLFGPGDARAGGDDGHDGGEDDADDADGEG